MALRNAAGQPDISSILTVLVDVALGLQVHRVGLGLICAFRQLGSL